ncbi:uncharacterized protein LOC144457580 [Phascolarctos cinereus]
MYLRDCHDISNTLCWCCHRKVWLRSEENCVHDRKEQSQD